MTNTLHTAKQYLVLVVPVMVIAGVFVIGSPTADAGITVTGDRQFTDDVNACLNTYRNAPGIVGDTIRELENSENDHSVIESPDWDNTPNDESDAMGGSGTGTVTRVDKAELEDLKEDFPELANKDFCTALLHELWHAADADGGGWSNDTTDGVLDDEIEATTFQNFIHSIRGVAIRTSYGGTDIGHILLAGETSVETSYKHVKPGEYSEVYSTVRTSPGAKVDATLSGPGVSGTAAQSVTADDKGVAKFTWKIVSYGKYTVAGDADGTAFSGTANVQ